MLNVEVKVAGHFVNKLNHMFGVGWGGKFREMWWCGDVSGVVVVEVSQILVWKVIHVIKYSSTKGRTGVSMCASGEIFIKVRWEVANICVVFRATTAEEVRTFK